MPVVSPGAPCSCTTRSAALRASSWDGNVSEKTSSAFYAQPPSCSTISYLIKVIHLSWSHQGWDRVAPEAMPQLALDLTPGLATTRPRGCAPTETHGEWRPPARPPRRRPPPVSPNLRGRPQLQIRLGGWSPTAGGSCRRRLP